MDVPITSDLAGYQAFWVRALAICFTFAVCWLAVLCGFLYWLVKR